MAGLFRASICGLKIYLRSIRAMKDAAQPPYVTFRENVVGRNFTLRCADDGMTASLHHGDMTAAYDVSFRTSDGSAEPAGGRREREPCPDTLLAPARGVISSLGVPQASPSPGAASTTSPADPQIGPPLIAAVHVNSARYYHIDLVGSERLGGKDVT